MASNRARGGLGRILRKNSSQKALKRATQRRGGVIILGSVQNVWLWQLIKWFGGEHDGGAGLTVVLDDPRGLLQFYDSTSGPSCPINSGPSEIQS